MSRRKTITTAIWLLLIASLSVMLFSGYRLWEVRQIYQKGDQSYELLRQQVRRQEQLIATDEFIDLEELRKVNSDAVAWLYCPGTDIDYPVMRADDYNWYLRHLPDGTYNANGSLFLDCNCPDDFSGSLSIIYGHHMKSGKMFGSLKGYKSQVYFEQHPSLYLYTEQCRYRIDLIYGCVISAGEWREKAFMYDINRQALLDYASAKTTFESSAGYTKDDKLIVLATCSYEFDDARYLVIGVLRQTSQELED